MTTISSHLLLLAVTILVIGVLTASAENEIYESRGIKSVNGGKQLTNKGGINFLEIDSLLDSCDDNLSDSKFIIDIFLFNPM